MFVGNDKERRTLKAISVDVSLLIDAIRKAIKKKHWKKHAPG